MKTRNIKKILLVLITFTLLNAGNEFVTVNQVGYLPIAEKYFISNVKADSFFIVSKINDDIVYTGQINLLATNDNSTGMTTYKGVFTEFESEGEFYIKLSTDFISYPFIIATDVFDDVFKKVMHSFYLQRCGMDLDKQYAGKFAHTACHTSDGDYHSETGESGKTDMCGGWHDAGDYGKYTHNSAATLYIMLLGYEQFPERHQSDETGINESNNNVPDFLDEIRYQLEWLLKMQDQSTGAAHYMINTKDYSWIMPQNDPAKRYIYGVASVSTGGFAAITAMASRIFESVDKDFATKLLDASKLAWTYLDNNLGLVPSGGYKRPSDTNTGGYAGWPDSYDKDERLWAAVELYLTTGEEEYGTYSDARLKNATNFYQDFSWLSVTANYKLSYMLAKQSFVDASIQSNLKTKFLSQCNSFVSNINKDGFHAGLKYNEYHWGSNGTLMGRGVYLILAHLLSGDTKYYNAALSQLNYILGVNGHNLSFVGKLGTNYVKNIHHAALETDGIEDIYPGLLAGGPNRDLSDPALVNAFPNGAPSAMCYVDDADSYSSNENCIFYSAPLVFVSAFFAQNKKLTSIAEIDQINDDSEIELSNYPNPFNNSTKIFFNLGFEDHLDFVIYDMLGRKIYKKRLGVLSSGQHEINWNGKNNSGVDVSSGVYVYSIEGKKNGSKQSKMILLK